MEIQDISFDLLVSQIQTTDRALQNNARLIINRHVTAKAWLTGYYIVEYELKGKDRALYGEQILQRLAEKLQNSKTFSYRSLKLYKQFYLAYKSLGAQIYSFVCSLPQIGQSLSAQLYIANSKDVTIRQTVSAQLPTTVKAESVLTTAHSCFSTNCRSLILLLSWQLTILYNEHSMRPWLYAEHGA